MQQRYLSEYFKYGLLHLQEGCAGVDLVVRKVNDTEATHVDLDTVLSDCRIVLLLHKFYGVFITGDVFLYEIGIKALIILSEDVV